MYCIETAKHVTNFFRPLSRSRSPNIIGFRTKYYGEILTPLKGGDIECMWNVKKSRFSTNISLYLGIDKDRASYC